MGLDITVKSTDLARELGLAASVAAGRKGAIPILSSARLEVDGGGNVTILATDLEVALRTSCPATVAARGGALQVPIVRLHEIARSLAVTDVRICADRAKGALRVTAAGFDGRLQGFLAEDFPSVPLAEGSSTDIPIAIMRELIRKTAFAITGDDTRYYLNGAFLEADNQGVRMVATDGHRLAVAASVAVKPTNECTAIIPRKALHELASLLDLEDDGDVTLTHGENHLFFDVGPRQLVSRMVDGKFPTWRNVVPTGHDKHLAVNRDQLLAAVRRMTYVQGERSRRVRLEAAGERTAVSAASADHGEATEQVEATFDGTAPVSISFNAQYVLDVLEVLPPGELLIDLRGEVEPVIIRSDNDLVQYRYVLMPIRE